MKKIDSVIYGIEVLAGSLAMAAISLLVFATVIGRYFLNTGILWADEVVVNLFVLLVMAGGALCFRYRKHTEMTLFLNVLPRMGRMLLQVILQIVVFVFLAVFLYSGILLTKSANGLTTSILRIPMEYIYVFLPFGTVLMLYEFLKDTGKRWREERQEKSKEI